MSAPSTLAAIRTKVRRFTGRPSPQQITDSEIDEYVNIFYQYDFPEHLRVFSNRGVFKFMTTANVDTYNMISSDPSNPAFNDLIVDFDGAPRQAQDVYINLQPPTFISGYQSFYSQDREQFFRTYPALGDLGEIDDNVIRGDGTPGPYNFTLAHTPFLQNQVSIGTIDDTGDTVKVEDDPQNRTTGNWLINNSTTSVTGSINYLTGVGTITFANSIPQGNEITFTFVPYEPNRPLAVLFYNNQITLRPVPDKVYPVEFNAFLTPSALINSTDNPIIKQWWQYLALGATKKIFEDSNDSDGVEHVKGPLKEQEHLVLYRHIVQQTNERTATIYTEMTAFPYGNFNNRF